MTTAAKTYKSNEKKVTVYCSVYQEAGIETQDDETGETVRLVAQKIRVHESGKEKLRFIYGRNKTVPKPLEIPEEDLPPRELEIVQLLQQARSYKEIAIALNISPHTVHANIKQIYARVHAQNRSEMLRQALERGWV